MNDGQSGEVTPRSYYRFLRASNIALYTLDPLREEEASSAQDLLMEKADEILGSGHFEG